MFKEDGRIYFESKEEGEKYIKEANARLEKAKTNYYSALYEKVQGDSEAYVTYILEHTPDEMIGANTWLIEKLRETMGNRNK